MNACSFLLGPRRLNIESLLPECHIADVLIVMKIEKVVRKEKEVSGTAQGASSGLYMPGSVEPVRSR